jgi:hypothetical protein
MPQNIFTAPTALALFAAITVSAALAAPAQAADAFNQNSSRSNNAPASKAYNQNNARSNHARAGIAAQDELNSLSDQLAQLEALLASMNEQMAQAEALSSSIAAAGTSVTASVEADTDAQADARVAIEDAQRIFDEQVAAMLDETTASAVRSQLQGQLADLDGAAAASPAFEALAASLEEITASIESTKQQMDELSKVVEKATSGLKDTLKTQV